MCTPAFLVCGCGCGTRARRLIIARFNAVHDPCVTGIQKSSHVASSLRSWALRLEPRSDSPPVLFELLKLVSGNFYLRILVEKADIGRQNTPERKQQNRGSSSDISPLVTETRLLVPNFAVYPNHGISDVTHSAAGSWTVKSMFVQWLSRRSQKENPCQCLG